jgi:FkbM family methyltransferase
MITKEVQSLGKISYVSDFSEDTFKFRHEKFSHLINKECVVLDIGAHIGSFSLLFASCANKVISFEPNPVVFDVLKTHVEKNPHLNIIPHRFACTQENKKYTFNYTDPNVYGMGSNGGLLNNLSNKKFKDAHSYQLEVDGVNVLDFLNKNYSSDIPNIKFIKIDAEGYDKEILKTLRPLIESNNPVLMVESFKFLTESELDDYFNTIDSFGYKIYDISPLDNITDCVGPLDIDEFKYYTYNICDNGNFLCVHKDQIKKYNLPDKVKGKSCVIIFGRNDGYKEPERFSIHIKTMLEIFDEIIYIDWNSEKSSFLYEVKNQIPNEGRIKHMVIPPHAVKQLINYDSNAQECNTSLAFNIGLRRTDAEYVVFATTDIIAPTKFKWEEFIKNTNKFSFYTLSRREVNYDDVIKNKETLNEFRSYLDDTSLPRYFPAKVTPNDNYSIFNCPGDFQFATKNVWHKIRGYEEGMLYSCFADTNVQKKSVLYGFNLVPVYNVPLYHMSHKNHIPQGGNANNLHEISKNRKPTVYNDAMEWVEYFNKYNKHDHIMISRNEDTWGFSDIEIECEFI